MNSQVKGNGILEKCGYEPDRSVGAICPVCQKSVSPYEDLVEEHDEVYHAGCWSLKAERQAEDSVWYRCDGCGESYHRYGLDGARAYHQVDEDGDALLCGPCYLQYQAEQADWSPNVNDNE